MEMRPFNSIGTLLIRLYLITFGAPWLLEGGAQTNLNFASLLLWNWSTLLIGMDSSKNKKDQMHYEIERNRLKEAKKKTPHTAGPLTQVNCKSSHTKVTYFFAEMLE